MNENRILIFNQDPELPGEFNTLNNTRVIPWSPPQANWNPWLAIKIHKTVSLF